MMLIVDYGFFSTSEQNIFVGFYSKTISVANINVIKSVFSVSLYLSVSLSVCLPTHTDLQHNTSSL